MCFVGLLLLTLLVSCSSDSNSADISYDLDKVASSIPFNRILFSSDTPNTDAYISVSGDGVSAINGLDEAIPLQDSLDISVSDEGKYQVEVVLYNQDIVPYLEDTLDWEYSKEVPPVPEIEFSELATSDTQIIMIFPDSKGINTNEVWIEGDLATDPNGAWYSIPLNGQVTLLTSEPDGLKTFTLRYRNIFGTEGDEASFSITKDSVAPSNCKANVASTTVTSSELELDLEADDPLSVFYQVSGDLRMIYDFQEFTSPERVFRRLRNEGSNEITVVIQDLAGNQCEPIVLSLIQDKGHSSAGLEFKDLNIVTESPRVIIQPRFDTLEEYTMIVSGDVLDTESTFTEISSQDEVEVVLNPAQGTRIVEISFLVDGEEVDGASNHIYLNPRPVLFGSDPNFQIALDKIPEIDYISITGCVEDLSSISFSPQVSCTRNDDIEVRYIFEDGTDFIKSFIF